MRALLGAGVVGVAAVALVGGSAGPANAGATPRCKTAGLVVWLDTNGDAAAGSTYFKLKLTNQSGHACTLTGYPGVSAVGLRGHRIGPAASRDPSVGPRTIRLANGATASAVLRIADALNFPTSACHPTMAAGLRVFPPNAFASKVVPFPFRACASTRVLTIRAVRRS